MDATTKRLRHDWEKRVGRPPYSLRGCISIPSVEAYGMNVEGYNAALRDMSAECHHFGVMVGCCEVCGMCLTHNYVLRNADGSHFVVGCDCVRHMGDTRMATEVEEMERERLRRAAADRRRAQWERERVAREARERLENLFDGAVTNWELWARRDREAQEAARQKAARAAADNEWLVSVLRKVPTGGEFIPSMIMTLRDKHLDDLSRRCVIILREIYGKAVAGKGKGQKARREAAEDEFDSHLHAGA